MKKLNIDAAKTLKIVSAVLGVAGMLISNKIQEHDLKATKAEIKQDVMKDLLSETKGS